MFDPYIMRIEFSRVIFLKPNLFVLPKFLAHGTVAM